MKAEALRVLAEAVATCTKCGLAQTRTQTVFGEGNPDAPLVIIGEGPGQQEDATGRPFVGKSGQLLDECLANRGISRKHIYISNVIRCRACDFENGRARNRPPSPEETLACRPWLDATVEIIKPLVILCLGSPSANAVIRKGFKITQERGLWFDLPYATYAIASFHPSYILRSHGIEFDKMRQTLIDDIELARLKVIEVRRVLKNVEENRSQL